mmetsp:Transcript_5850/g.14837  ORF Transcript_5850/g.14837 Transcript_5850/m.14837 type:complete len:106 (+) Transcript_5850:103-420(+)
MYHRMNNSTQLKPTDPCTILVACTSFVHDSSGFIVSSFIQQTHFAHRVRETARVTADASNSLELQTWERLRLSNCAKNLRWSCISMMPFVRDRTKIVRRLQLCYY